MTDRDALDAWLDRRDEDALALLVDRHRRMVFAVCRRRLGQADAEDATQEVFLKLIARGEQVETNVAAWLHRAAVTTSIDRGRAVTRERRVGAPRSEALERVAAPGGDPVEEAELRAELDAAVDGLDEPVRALVVGHYLGQRTQTELAAEAGVSVATVSRRIAAAVASLRERLEGRGLGAATGVGVAALLAGQAAAEAPEGLTLRILGAARDPAGGPPVGVEVPAAGPGAGAGPGPSVGMSPGSGSSVLPWAVAGLLVACVLGLWVLTRPVPAAVVPPVVVTPVTPPAAEESPLRVGWILQAGADAGATAGRLTPLQPLLVSSTLELSTLVVGGAVEPVDRALNFLGSTQPAARFGGPASLERFDVVVVDLDPEGPLPVVEASRVWSAAAAAWAGGAGVVAFARGGDGSVAADELMLAEATSILQGNGGEALVPAEVLEGHPLLGGLGPGAAVDTCVCGVVADPLPEARVLAVLDPAALPGAAAGVAGTRPPLVMVAEGDGRAGRRVMINTREGLLFRGDGGTGVPGDGRGFVERAVAWAGGE